MGFFKRGFLFVHSVCVLRLLHIRMFVTYQQLQKFFFLNVVNEITVANCSKDVFIICKELINTYCRKTLQPFPEKENPEREE